MTLTLDMQSRILDLTKAHWTKHVRDESFAELIEGKEPGHRIADYVDDRTSSLLKVNLDTRYESDGKGSIRKRSMGDIWVRSHGMYNPINVKSGLQAMNGQPNVVSMQKLLDYIIRAVIDSYYLLIIKFDLSKGISHKSYLIDLLDWTDFITYDAGPGQIMLREQYLYQRLDAAHVPQYQTIFEKVNGLLRLFEKQLSSLIINRQQRLERQQKLVREFQHTEFVVDQSHMEFVP